MKSNVPWTQMRDQIRVLRLQAKNTQIFVLKRHASDFKSKVQRHAGDSSYVTGCSRSTLAQNWFKKNLEIASFHVSYEIIICGTIGNVMRCCRERRQITIRY